MARRSRSGLLALACTAALLAGTPGAALAWNAATHAWVARELNRERGQVTAPELSNRIYGANAADLFNAHFTPAWWVMQQLLHDPAGDAFLWPWWLADGPAEEAFAWGFATHNNAWGVDATAHTAGITGGREEGWIVEKAAELAPRIGPALAAAGLELPEEVLLLVSHILVEQGVDFLLVELDPSLAPLLVETAMARDPAVAGLLAQAFAPAAAPLVGGMGEAVDFVLGAEAEFRAGTVAYGWALQQPNARQLVAFGIGQQAEEFLGLPPGSGGALVPLIDWAVGEAMTLCAADWRREVWATRGYVNGRLGKLGIAP